MANFRQDLFHRIYVFPMVLPPLRERRENVPAIVDHFASQVTAQNGWKPAAFTPEVVRALQEQPWPGNIRELRNVIERLLLLASDGQVNIGDFARGVARCPDGTRIAIQCAGPLGRPGRAV